MNPQVTNVLVGILIIGIVETSIQCGYDGPDSCPHTAEDDAFRVELEAGDYELTDAKDGHNLLGTEIGEEAYLRVLSDSEVELIFEQEGEVVVQVFDVTNRDTVIRR